MEKHYVIVNNWANEYENGTIIIGVAHSMEKAKEIFNKRLVEEKQYASEMGFIIYDESETVFDAGLDGYYMTGHTNLYIQMV